MLISGTTSGSALEGSQSADSEAQLEEDLNRFLNLLVTQLKNQDPLDPMDSSEFTSQLVQFASVEQQIFQNSNLETLVELQQTNQISSMVDFIDKVVEVDGTSFPLENSVAEFTYTMPQGARSASVIIRDSSGLSVLERDADLDAGQHTFDWDGKDNFGQVLPDGEYAAFVTGLSNSGEVLQITQTVFGRITGIGVDGSDTTLFMGDIEVPQAKVLAVKQAEEAVN